MVFFPLLVVIAILLRLTGEGEIFYLQERIGKDEKIFKLFKFATMLKNSSTFGTGTVTVKNDLRILPIGKFLRKSKINELPQLLNVLFGDMSIIGPRPLTKETFDFYDINTQKFIGKVRPGLSGIGSIVFRGEEDMLTELDSPLVFYKNTIAPYKGALEIWFVLNYTVVTYLKAIIITIVVVLSPRSQIVWKVFRGLPLPPNDLKNLLKFPEI